MTPSAASRVVARLEERLGARLLQRTTRRLSLTEIGAAFYERATRVLTDLADAEAEAGSRSVSPKGLVRISAPVVFGRLHLVPTLHILATTYPDLSLELSFTDDAVDLIEDGVDLAIRIGRLTESRLVARRLCSNQRVVVASPDYLNRHGAPEHPADLADHECLIFTALRRPREWRLTRNGVVETVCVSGRFSATNGEVVTEMAKAGMGICLGATFSVGPALRSGELVRVLPNYAFPDSGIHVVYPSGRQLSRKVTAVVDQLARQFRDPPVWDQGLLSEVAIV